MYVCLFIHCLYVKSFIELKSHLGFYISINISYMHYLYSACGDQFNLLDCLLFYLMCSNPLHLLGI